MIQADAARAFAQNALAGLRVGEIGLVDGSLSATSRCRVSSARTKDDTPWPPRQTAFSMDNRSGEISFANHRTDLFAAIIGGPAKSLQTS